MFDLNKRHALVVGMARSGIEAAKLLIDRGAKVSLYDAKPIEKINNIDEISIYAIDKIFGGASVHPLHYDLIVLSPGVPTQLPFLVEARKKGIEVIGEIELAYRCSQGIFIGITGTNGKTTTTTLTSLILKEAGLNAVAVGNIGIPLSRQVRLESKDTVIYVTELSSYQLESVVEFKPYIGALLNITPDHLARHKTMENYTQTKLNMVKNLANPQYFLLNADDPISSTLNNAFKGASLFSKHKTNATFGVEDHHIIIREKGKKIPVICLDDIFIKGEHSIENALVAIGIAHYMGVSKNISARILKSFKGVAHRNEWVLTHNGITFYNDSKATNPEASIPALKSMDKPTVLIAGGMDKGSDYAQLINHFDSVVHVVLLGETKHQIASVLENIGFVDYTLVSNMKEAVDVALLNAKAPMNILLSPACASWDMYENFEVRGEDFKRCIQEAIK